MVRQKAPTGPIIFSSLAIVPSIFLANIMDSSVIVIVHCHACVSTTKKLNKKYMLITYRFNLSINYILMFSYNNNDCFYETSTS